MSEDVRQVLATARLLGVTEFEVFASAYRAWYQRPLAAALLERHFVAYLFAGVAPFWVRHFTRAILGAQRRRGRHRESGAAAALVLGQLLVGGAVLRARLRALPRTHRLIA